MGERWKPTQQTYKGFPVYAISPEYVDLHHDVLAHADVGYRAGWEIEQRDVRIAEQDATIAALRADLEEARVKVPQTADGVPVYPGDKLHPFYPDEEWELRTSEEDAAVIKWCIRDPLSGELIEQDDGLVIDTCYSTREAALLARVAEGVGDKPAWVFEIDEAFTVKGRGTVVTGTPRLGTPKVGDAAWLGGNIKTSVTSVEMTDKNGVVSKNIGLLLRGVTVEQAHTHRLLTAARTTHGEGE